MMQTRAICPQCRSVDVHVGDAVAACESCGYWGSSQHFFAHELIRGPAGGDMKRAGGPKLLRGAA